MLSWCVPLSRQLQRPLPGFLAVCLDLNAYCKPCVTRNNHQGLQDRERNKASDNIKILVRRNFGPAFPWSWTTCRAVRPWPANCPLQFTRCASQCIINACVCHCWPITTGVCEGACALLTALARRLVTSTATPCYTSPRSPEHTTSDLGLQPLECRLPDHWKHVLVTIPMLKHSRPFFQPSDLRQTSHCRGHISGRSASSDHDLDLSPHRRSPQLFSNVSPGIYRSRVAQELDAGTLLHCVTP